MGNFFSSLKTKVGKFFLAVFDWLVIIATNPNALQGYQSEIFFSILGGKVWNFFLGVFDWLVIIIATNPNAL